MLNDPYAAPFMLLAAILFFVCAFLIYDSYWWKRRVRDYREKFEAESASNRQLARQRNVSYVALRNRQMIIEPVQAILTKHFASKNPGRPFTREDRLKLMQCMGALQTIQSVEKDNGENYGYEGQDDPNRFAPNADTASEQGPQEGIDTQASNDEPDPTSGA